MRELLVLLSAFTGLSSFANECTKCISFRELKSNIDETITVLEPRLVRGARRHLIHFGTARASMSGVCKAMGFSNYLEQSAQGKFDIEGIKKAYLNDDGSFNSLVSHGRSHFLNEITCYNKLYSSVVQASGYINAPDGTITILDPRLVRGAKRHLIHFGTARASMSGVCKAMGFSNYLEQSAQREFDFEGIKKAYINDDGNFNSLVNHGRSGFLNEITCYNKGQSRTLFIGKDGKYYLKSQN